MRLEPSTLSKHPAKAALLVTDFSVTKLLIDEWRRRAKCDMH